MTWADPTSLQTVQLYCSGNSRGLRSSGAWCLLPVGAAGSCIDLVASDLCVVCSVLLLFLRAYS